VQVNWDRKREPTYQWYIYYYMLKKQPWQFSSWSDLVSNMQENAKCNFKEVATYLPRCPDFNCPRLTRSATEPLLSRSRLLTMTPFATAAKSDMPRKNPVMKFSPMFLRICIKREGLGGVKIGWLSNAGKRDRP
jgi:hypothetical protein